MADTIINLLLSSFKKTRTVTFVSLSIQVSENNFIAPIDTEVTLEVFHKRPMQRLAKTNDKGCVMFDFPVDQPEVFEIIIQANGAAEKFQVNPQTEMITDSGPTPPTPKPKFPPNTVVCNHCRGEATCSNKQLFGKVHSCDYCQKKAEVQIDGLFPIVPCAYCRGVGFHEIGKKPQDKRTSNPPTNNYKGKRR